MLECKDIQVSLEDLYQAYVDCRRRKKSKKGAVSFEPYALHTLCCLRDEINERRYRLKPSQCLVVKYPVPREVFCASFRDRIVQHFVYNELNPIIERIIIRDTASCRRNKGTDYAIRRCTRFVRRETENYTTDAVFGKFDLSGFFMSIDRQRLLEKMLWVVDNLYTGPYKSVLKYLLPIIILTDVTVNAVRLSPKKDWDLIPANKTLFGNDRGLPIGNITSQLFANFYLNDLDHLIKSRHRSYERYVDDMVIVDRDSGRIERTKELSIELLEEMGMKMNLRKSIISDVRFGIMFLGVKIMPHYNILGKKRIGRLYYTTSRKKNVEEMYASCASRKGGFTRYHGRRIAARFYRNQVPDEWKDRLKMDSDATFHLVGGDVTDNTKLRNIRLYG